MLLVFYLVSFEITRSLTLFLHIGHYIINNRYIIHSLHTCFLFDIFFLFQICVINIETNFVIILILYVNQSSQTSSIQRNILLFRD